MSYRSPVNPFPQRERGPAAPPGRANWAFGDEFPVARATKFGEDMTGALFNAPAGQGEAIMPGATAGRFISSDDFSVILGLASFNQMSLSAWLWLPGAVIFGGTIQSTGYINSASTVGAGHFSCYAGNPIPSQVSIGFVNWNIGTSQVIISGCVGGAWNHVVATWNGPGGGTTISGYRSGVLQVDTGTRAASGAYVAGVKVELGKQIQTAASVTSGMWSRMYARDVALWNRGITSGEALALYNSGSPLNITVSGGTLTSGLRAWWRMGDGIHDSPDAIFDQSGNGFHLYPDAIYPAQYPRPVEWP